MLSLMMSASILRGLPTYRQQEWIPNITLSKYAKIINNDDDYDDFMAILFPQTDLYSKTITMRHLWITAQKLRREADRQEIKARRMFMEMEGLGLQQVLCPHWNTPPREFFSPVAQPPTPYYPAPGQETRYQESVEQSPTPPPMSPPLEAWGNPIIIAVSDEDEDGQDDNFYPAELTFSTPISFLLHCQECQDWWHQYFECPQYICNHCYQWAPMHRVSNCPEHWSQWLQP